MPKYTLTRDGVPDYLVEWEEHEAPMRLAAYADQGYAATDGWDLTPADERTQAEPKPETAQADPADEPSDELQAPDGSDEPAEPAQHDASDFDALDLTKEI